MSIAIYQQCTVLVIFVVLIVATYYDCKSSIIPLYLFPVLAGVVIPLSVIHGQPQIADSLFGMLIGICTFFFLALFFKGGGADILMMGVLGWCFGVHGTIILILASSGIYALFATIMLCYCYFIKKEIDVLRKQYPFAPFVLTGYVICLLFGRLF